MTGSLIYLGLFDSTDILELPMFPVPGIKVLRLSLNTYIPTDSYMYISGIIAVLW